MSDSLQPHERCDPIDYSPLGSSVHGIFQARILEWIAISSSRGSSQPRDQILASCVSHVGRQVLYHGRHLGSLHPPNAVELPRRKGKRG